MIIFIGFVASTILGIDIGSENTKASIVRLGKNIEIAYNNNSNQELFPTFFAFWNTTDPKQNISKHHWSLADVRECSWSFFEDARSHYFKYPNNVITGLTPLLDQKNGITRRESFAIFLKHLLTTINQDVSSSNLIISVDPFLTRQERYVIRESVKLAGANLKRIVDSPSSVAYLYSQVKKPFYSKSPKNVAFIDIGATKTIVSIFNFRSTPGDPIVRQLSLTYDINLGGNDIDALLFTHFISNQTVSPKVLYKLKLAKEKLSIYSTATVSLGNNKKITISRSDLELLLTDFIDKIGFLYREALQKANLSLYDINSVELIGGTTRIPYIQSSIQSISGIGFVNNSLNPNEAIALGSGCYEYIKDVQIESLCNENISILHFNKTISLFNETNYISDSTTYLYNKKTNGNISILYGNQRNEIVKFYVNLPSKALDNVTIRLDFGFDEFTLPGIFNIMTNKLKSNNISFYLPKWTLTKREFNQSLGFIKRINEIEEERKKIKKALNDFETYLYDSKKKFIENNIFKEVTLKEEYENVIKLIDDDLNWIFNQTNNIILNSKVINNRWKKVKDLIDKIELRASELHKRGKSFDNLLNMINIVNKSINEIWPETRPWMTEKVWNNINEALNHAIKYYKKFTKKQKNCKVTDDPKVLAKDIDMQTYYLEIAYNHSLRVSEHPPTPKPPKTPNPYVKTYNSVDELERDIQKIENEMNYKFNIID